MSKSLSNRIISGSLSATGDISTSGKLNVNASAGDEGGEIFLAAATTNSTITNGVTIDVYQNKLRIFEQGGSARGFYLDITTGGAGVSTNLTSGGGGSGTVTSVGLTVPTGLSVSGSPITTSGTIAISLASGYSIPTTASQLTWDTAYGWGNHASAGYLTTASAASTYLTQSSAASTYLTTSSASSTYAPKTSPTFTGTVTTPLTTAGYVTTTSLGVLGSVATIPNAGLTNSSITVNGTSISLGGSATVTAAAGTLTGSTLASGVTGSSLTSVGTLTSLTTSGKSYLGVSSPATTLVGNYITAVSSTGTTATLTTNVYHGLAVGDTITVAGVTPTGYNITNATVTAVSAATPWTFSYTTAGSNLGAVGFVSGAGTVTTTGLTLNTKSISVNGVDITSDGSTQMHIGAKQGMISYFGTPANTVDMYVGDSGGYFRYNGSSRLGITSTGTIGASGVYGNTLSTSYRAVYVTSSTAPDTLGYVASSRSMKKAIEPLSYTAEQILSIEPVEYLYKAEPDTNPKHAGFIVEDLEDAGLHAYISYGEDGVTPETINYEFYVSALQQVVRHQAAQITNLIARVEALESK